MRMNSLVIWTSKVWSFQHQKFGHLDVKSLVISTSKVTSFQCQKIGREHVKKCVFNIPATSFLHSLVDRVRLIRIFLFHLKSYSKVWDLGEGGKAKWPWTLWKSLRNPAETVSEPCRKSLNPVRSQTCVIRGEIA